MQDMSKKTQSQEEKELDSPVTPAIAATSSSVNENDVSLPGETSVGIEKNAPSVKNKTSADAPAALSSPAETPGENAAPSASDAAEKRAPSAAAERRTSVSATDRTASASAGGQHDASAAASGTAETPVREAISPDAGASRGGAEPAGDSCASSGAAGEGSSASSASNIGAAEAGENKTASEAASGAPGTATAHAPSSPGYEEEDLSQYETSAKEAGLEACGSDINSDDFVHPADRAEHLEQLPLNKQLCVLTHLSTEEAAEALAELDEEVAGDVLENMDADDAARLIAEMDPDDAVDILDEVEEGHRDILLSNLPADDAEELRMLLSFDPDTAAGVMNTDIIMVSSSSTVDEAIMLIRSELEEKEMPYYVYVVDSQETLEGVISLRDLMLAKPGTLLTNMVNKQDVISVQYDTDKAEVARLLGHYNFLCLPVVDREEHLMGVVTHDDVLDIIQDEASSDMLGMVGAGQDENVDTPWTRSVRIRLPWLVINMCTSSLSAFIVSMFEGSIAQMALLAVLMPMVANQAGNTGQQALAVMIRQLATESFDARRSWGAVFRESKIGLGTGIFMALLAYIGVMFLSRNSMLATVMGIALLLDMLLGAVAGGAIPLVLRALGRDPAQASSIFLTALTDSGGFFIFLGLATTFLL